MNLRLVALRAVVVAVVATGCGGDDGAAPPAVTNDAGADAPIDSDGGGGGPVSDAGDAGDGATVAPTFTVGGTVSGLSRVGLVLQNAGKDPIAVTSNGPFVFATALPDGADYAVTVASQPEAQTCTVMNGTGKVSGAPIANVVVSCVDGTTQLGGERQGLALALTGQVTTLAGTAVTKDAIAANANFLGPDFMLEQGGSLYVADTAGLLLRKVDLATGAVTTVAGHPSATSSIDGVGTAAGFLRPAGIASDGTNLYVADDSTCKIRKLVIATGAVTTIAGASCAATLDGNGAAARFFLPRGLAIDGTTLYVAESFAVRKVDLVSGDVTTLAGGTSGSDDGVGAAAKFEQLFGIVRVDGDLYVSDRHSNTIRKIAIATGTVTTVVGAAGVRGSADGTGTAATLALPHGLATDGVDLYIAAAGSDTIRKMSLTTGAVTTIAGASDFAGSVDGIGASARFDRPEGLALAGTSLYVSDNANRTIRKIALATGSVTTIASTPAGTNGVGAAARFAEPGQVTTDGVNAFVADPATGTIRKIVIATGAVTTLAGTPSVGGYSDAVGPLARFRNPSGVTTDGSNVYVADSGNHRIRKIVVATGEVTTLAGDGIAGSADGTGTGARFNDPRGITNDGANLYVSDTSNHRIRKIVIATGVVTTLAGSTFGTTDGVGAGAKLFYPEGIATDATALYVADTGSNNIRKLVIATGAVTTFAGAAVGAAGSADGTGTSARFRNPRGIGMDGTNLYVADSGNHTLRRIVIATGAVTTIAGAASTVGVVDGQGNAARFYWPAGIATDGARLLVTDSVGATLRSVK